MLKVLSGHRNIAQVAADVRVLTGVPTIFGSDLVQEPDFGSQVWSVKLDDAVCSGVL